MDLKFALLFLLFVKWWLDRLWCKKAGEPAIEKVAPRPLVHIMSEGGHVRVPLMAESERDYLPTLRTEPTGYLSLPYWNAPFFKML